MCLYILPVILTWEKQEWLLCQLFLMAGRILEVQMRAQKTTNHWKRKFCLTRRREHLHLRKSQSYTDFSWYHIAGFSALGELWKVHTYSCPFSTRLACSFLDRPPWWIGLFASGGSSTWLWNLRLSSLLMGIVERRLMSSSWHVFYSKTSQELVMRLWWYPCALHFCGGGYKQIQWAYQVWDGYLQYIQYI